jgi:hypothetical protein
MIFWDVLGILSVKTRLIIVLHSFAFKNRVGILGGRLVRMFPWGANAQIWECPPRKHECNSQTAIASMQVEFIAAPLRGFCYVRGLYLEKLKF